MTTVYRIAYRDPTNHGTPTTTDHDTQEAAEMHQTQLRLAGIVALMYAIGKVEA